MSKIKLYAHKAILTPKLGYGTQKERNILICYRHTRTLIKFIFQHSKTKAYSLNYSDSAVNQVRQRVIEYF